MYSPRLRVIAVRQKPLTMCRLPEPNQVLPSVVETLRDKAVSRHNNNVIVKNTSMENSMKTMTCNQLGGACEKEFSAVTFKEIAEMSKQHGMKMFQKKDEAHLNAMSKMQELMKSPEDMEKWFESKREEFEALPDS
jgi:Flp pilus assembly CpaF family ATPase